MYVDKPGRGNLTRLKMGAAYSDGTTKARTHSLGSYPSDVSVSAMQTSQIVAAYYECLKRGDEYSDGAWQRWHQDGDDWQYSKEPTSEPSQAAPSRGQGGRGDCFKYVAI